MCMLTFLPEGILPNIERLKNGTRTNRDGHGWAIVVLNEDGQGTHILTGHSMNADAAIEAFRLTREKHPQGPALFHSRYTTGGTVDEANCHPYVVNGDPRTILAHNGVLPGSLKQPFKDQRSDTRYFCDEWGFLLYPLAAQLFPGENYNLRSKRGRKRLSRWIGNGNKFVILTVDPAFSKCSYLINEEQGYWEDDGCWYSNSGYRPYTPPASRAWSSSYGWDNDDWSYYAGTSAKDGVKRWWEEAPIGGAGTDSVSVWEGIARDLNGVPLVDKGFRLEMEPPTPDTVCIACQAKGCMDRLGYCLICGTCEDCGGYVLRWGEVDSCGCLYPTGQHPARSYMLSDAAEGPERPEKPSRGAADATVEAATAEVLTLGPPVAQKALPPGPSATGAASE
jgi:hypothetical protein